MLKDSPITTRPLSNMSTRINTNSPPPRPHLLSLPFQLCKIIFQYALTGSLISLSPSFTTKPHGVAEPLLVTCSQINQEATPLLYSSNTFLFEISFLPGVEWFDLPNSFFPILSKIQNVVVFWRIPVDMKGVPVSKTAVGNLHALTNLKA